jgi:hypothetical protein
MARQQGLPVIPVGGDYTQTYDIGGSRFGMWAASGVNPAGMVGATTTTTLATLSVPPTYDTMGSGSVYTPGVSAPAAAAASPWDPRVSPLMLVILALIISAYGIHKLYFDDKR